MALITSRRHKEENQYYGCNIHYNNSIKYTAVYFSENSSTKIDINKIYNMKPETVTESSEPIFCRQYHYTTGTLQTGIKSLKCYRKSALMSSIPLGEVPHYVYSKKVWSGLLLEIYNDFYDHGVFYGDEIWFTAEAQDGYDLPNPLFTLDGTPNGRVIDEDHPLRVGIDTNSDGVITDITAINFLNDPELRSYTLNFVGRREDASYDGEHDTYDTNITFTNDSGTSVEVDLQDLITVNRTYTQSSDGTGPLQSGNTIYAGDKLTITASCNSYINDLFIKTGCYASTICGALPTVNYQVQNGQPGNDGFWNGWTTTTIYKDSTTMIDSIVYNVTVSSDINLEVFFDKKTWRVWDLLIDPHARTGGVESGNLTVGDEGHVLWWEIGGAGFTSENSTNTNAKHDVNILKNLRYFPTKHISAQEWCAFGETSTVPYGENCETGRAWIYSELTRAHNVRARYALIWGEAQLRTATEILNNKQVRSRGLQIKEKGGLYQWAYRIGGIKIKCSEDYDPTIWRS